MICLVVVVFSGPTHRHNLLTMTYSLLPHYDCDPLAMGRPLTSSAVECPSPPLGFLILGDACNSCLRRVDVRVRVVEEPRLPMKVAPAGKLPAGRGNIDDSLYPKGDAHLLGWVATRKGDAHGQAAYRGGACKGDTYGHNASRQRQHTRAGVATHKGKDHLQCGRHLCPQQRQRCM
ncbi:hypothetical protein B296_00005740 [Ensete ventricosum]|uniref:Uncharacterized protein n=1 Tax=Ensete ventricosum TaxID=4639 RepID=A0A426Z159_ENSVE|nr:hypothetical protein B296_00005740 [Ensete ventricosum]